MRNLKLAIALCASLIAFACPALAQSGYAKVQSPWFPQGKISGGISVTNSSAATLLPSSGQDAWICNTGTADVQLAFGPSNTISVTVAGGTTLKAGTCWTYDLKPFTALQTYVAAISGTSSTLTVETGIGTGPYQLSTSGGGGGGGAVFGPTAVGSANANPPVMIGGTSDGTATGLVGIMKVAGGLGYINCANCSGSGASAADGAAFVAGTSVFAPSGAIVQTTATSNPVTTGDQGLLQMTQYRALFANIRNSSGAEVVFNTNGQQASAASSPVVIASDQSPISVTSNVADNTTDSGNSVKIGGLVNTGSPTAQSTGVRSPVWMGDRGSMANFITSQTGTSVATVSSPAADGITTGVGTLYSQTFPTVFNGTTFDRVRAGTTTGSVLINGAGTAGTASGGVLTVQGVASMTPILSTVTNAGIFAVQLNATPSLANGNGVVPTQGGAVLSATNGIYTNLLQGNVAIASGNPLFAQLTAGSALIGKFGIDQTTVGTTNGVSIAQIGANTVATGNGVSGIGVQRVNIASDNTAFSVNLGTIGTAATAANQTSQITQETATATAVGTPTDAVASAPTSATSATMIALLKALVNTGQYPAGATAITASATGTTAATTATLAGTSGKTTYICGLSIRANATAAATGNATVTGTITGTLNFTQWIAPLASGLGVTEQIFNPCVPASTTNTGIAIVSAAPGSGGVVSSTGWGYQL